MRGRLSEWRTKGDDLTVNVCKKKHMTAVRSSGHDDALRLVPPIKFSLEQSLEFIADDELYGVTPKNIRLRKRYSTTRSARITMRNRAAAK